MNICDDDNAIKMPIKDPKKHLSINRGDGGQVCIKLINKYPARTVPILICIPFKFMGKPGHLTLTLTLTLTP